MCTCQTISSCSLLCSPMSGARWIALTTYASARALHGLQRPRHDIEPQREMQQRLARRQLELQRVGHGVASNVRLGWLERPPLMMDVPAPEPASAISSIEAVALGEP